MPFDGRTLSHPITEKVKMKGNSRSVSKRSRHHERPFSDGEHAKQYQLEVSFNVASIFQTLVALTSAETCIRFLKNHEEDRIFRTIPGHVWRWNTFTQEFEEIQAVKMNGTAVCSVKMANNLRGKTIVVAADTVGKGKPRKLRFTNFTRLQILMSIFRCIRTF